MGLGENARGIWSSVTSIRRETPVWANSRRAILARFLTLPLGKPGSEPLQVQCRRDHPGSQIGSWRPKIRASTPPRGVSGLIRRAAQCVAARFP